MRGHTWDGVVGVDGEGGQVGGGGGVVGGGVSGGRGGGDAWAGGTRGGGGGSTVGVADGLLSVHFLLPRFIFFLISIICSFLLLCRGMFEVKHTKQVNKITIEAVEWSGCVGQLARRRRNTTLLIRELCATHWRSSVILWCCPLGEHWKQYSTLYYRNFPPYAPGSKAYYRLQRDGFYLPRCRVPATIVDSRVLPPSHPYCIP